MTRAAWGALATLVSGTVALAACGSGAAVGQDTTGDAAAGTPAAVATPPVAVTAPPATTTPAAAQGTGAPGDGTFAVEGTASTASYTAHETFLQQNSPFVPVGKTQAITGDLVLSGGKFAASRITVDLRTLKTDNAMRDRHIQQDPLQTGTYPDAVFAVTGAQGPAVADGQAVDVKLTGNMTIHGQTKPTVWDAKVALQGATLHLTGSAAFNLSDFGMQPPDIAGFVSVQPAIALAVDLVAQRG